MIAVWVALAFLISAVVVLAGIPALDDRRSRRVVGFSVKCFSAK